MQSCYGASVTKLNHEIWHAFMDHILGMPLSQFLSCQERNVHGMKLIEGEGNTYDSRGKALEGDRFNTVFIVVCCISSTITYQVQYAVSAGMQ